MKDIVLGNTYTDTITGFSGVATGHCEYLTGCNQVLLVPKVGPDGAMRSGEWFDQQRVTLVDAPTVSLDNGQTPGADRPAPKSNQHAPRA